MQILPEFEVHANGPVLFGPAPHYPHLRIQQQLSYFSGHVDLLELGEVVEGLFGFYALNLISVVDVRKDVQSGADHTQHEKDRDAGGEKRGVLALRFVVKLRLVFAEGEKLDTLLGLVPEDLEFGFFFRHFIIIIYSNCI